MDAELLITDCSRCAALCCVALAFDKSDLFAIDKAAGHPCANLKSDGRCGIHHDLKPKGFVGCIRYDCSGAGQRVVNEVFDGDSWQSDPSLLGPMMRAFATMRQVHECLLLLNEALNLDLPKPEKTRIEQMVSRLGADRKWTREALADFASEPFVRETNAILTSLAKYVARAPE